MRLFNIPGVLLFLLLLGQINLISAQAPLKITVLANEPGAQISPTMWGIFFEDINFSADGGLYAELVKNRSFEFASPLMGWKQTSAGSADASVLIVNRSDANAGNPRYASIELKNNKGSFILANEGFRGMGLENGHQYNFSLLAHAVKGNVKISVQAVNEAGEPIGQAALQPVNGDWQAYKTKFICTQTSAKAKLNVIFEGEGIVAVDMISMFPADTWKNRANGLRNDLAQKLADLHPGFMRFPGGCIVEGRDLANRYQWKKTTGDIAGRQLIMNRWNTEFSYRSAPDYFQSFGLGFFEYFQLCEDIGASPLPILNCGMACQYNSAEAASTDQLDPYIQDALDLVEFANGGTDTKWGGLRAAMGHAAPFNLKMIGVGNEQWGEQYVERYKLFSAAIRKVYPAIKMITSAGPAPEGAQFDYLSKAMKEENASLIDEHYYRPPNWFLENAARYDGYDRQGTKVFAGEYAAHIDDATQKDAHPESHNTWWAALCEAAFMTGLERNADVVQMASYAPLLAHVDAWQWRPDLIWFDNLHSVATPNYYVQQAFAAHKGNRTMPVLANGKTLAGRDSLYSSAVIDTVNNQLIVKIINTSARKRLVNLNIKNKHLAKQAKLIQISGADKMAFNSVDHPDVIKPVSQNIAWAAKDNTINLPALSVNVFIIPGIK